MQKLRLPELESAHRPEAPGAISIAHIDSLNYDGRGVARIDGKAVFIEGALPQEDVRLRYHQKYRNYATGVVTEVIRPSAARRLPACPYFGTCGGCSLQHMESLAQVEAKQQILAESLAHIGRVQPARWLAPLVGLPWHYRRRARLGVRVVQKKGGVLIGFREKRRSFITPLASCLTLDQRASGLLPALRELVTQLSRPERIPQIEVAAGDNELAFVFRHLVPFTANDLECLSHFGQQHRVQIYGQPDAPASLQCIWPQAPPPLHYMIDNIKLEFQPTDFIQVNQAINQQLVDQTVALLEPREGDRILDLFCGLGNFTLPLARRSTKVWGMEIDAELVNRARHNARINQVANVEFRPADLYAVQDGDRPWQDLETNKVLLDPPRTGAMDVIKRLAQDDRLERILYISCHPATLARDSAYLVRMGGYRLEAAGVADMFPQTSHVESLALFVRA